MLHPASIHFDCEMPFNEIKLKPGVTLERVETSIGEACNVVENIHGGKRGGFIAGELDKFAGSVSVGCLVGGTRQAQDHMATATCCNSFEEHEESRADTVFKEKFPALTRMYSESREIEHDMLWQGSPEPDDVVRADVARTT